MNETDIKELIKETEKLQRKLENKENQESCLNFILSAAGFITFYVGLIFDILDAYGCEHELTGAAVGLILLVVFGVALILFAYLNDEVLLNLANNKRLNSLLCTHTGLAAILFGCEKMIIIPDDLLCVEIIFLAGSIIVLIGFSIGCVLENSQSRRLNADEVVEK